MWSFGVALWKKRPPCAQFRRALLPRDLQHCPRRSLGRGAALGFTKCLSEGIGFEAHKGPGAAHQPSKVGFASLWSCL